MALSIGVMSIAYLETPNGLAYQFASEMARTASYADNTWGETSCWAPFTRDEIDELLDDFTVEKSLTQDQKAEVWAWVDSLPWDGDDLELYLDW